MHAKKVSFFILLSFLFSNLQSTDKVKARELRGSFRLAIEKKNIQAPLSAHDVRIKLIPGKDFSGFGSDNIEGFSGILFGSNTVFFKLPNEKAISFAAFLSSIFDTKERSVKTLDKEEVTALTDLFFEGNTTDDRLASFTFEDAYEVTLKDEKPALVLTPHLKE